MSFKIYRNGKEIELTPEELMNAHTAYEKDSMITDIKQTLEDDEEYPILSDVSIPAIAEKALNNLSKCDRYFEAFWDSVRQTINSHIDVLLGTEYDRLVKMGIQPDDTISFSYKNIDGYEISPECTVRELFDDWMGECIVCPSNDTRVYSVVLEDNTFEVLNFDELMKVIKNVLTDSNTQHETAAEEDASIGVNIMFNGEPATITLHLYTQKDFMGVDRSGIALMVQEADGDYALTVSLGDFIGMKNAAYVDTNNCGTELINALVENGFAKDTCLSKRSGFCIYPLYLFNEDFLRTAGSEEYAKYLEDFEEE